MTSMQQLDVAMNPDRAIVDRTEVCGMRVPTAAELWQAILITPQAVWDSAVALGISLPSLGEMWDVIKATPSQALGVIRGLFGMMLTIEWAEIAWPHWDLNPFDTEQVP